MRQKHPGLHKRGKDISLGAMKKIAESFQYISFCGQMGDPIYHPKFLDILSICKNNTVEISTAGSGKKIEWWEEAALISSNQTWVFGIDGLPSQSNQYRIGQDGEQTFQMMKHISNIGAKVVWQMIVFKYNQDSIEKVRLMAKENNIDLVIIESSRWDIPYDKYKPDKHYKDRPSM
jgi:MoaA/NifB/PqqE/SkfB family radical SAM enzyme